MKPRREIRRCIAVTHDGRCGRWTPKHDVPLCTRHRRGFPAFALDIETTRRERERLAWATWRTMAEARELLRRAA